MKVRLVNAFTRPLDNVVAAARSCYAPRPFTAEMAAGEHLDDPQKRRQAEARRLAIARSVYEAGHHTTYQHAHFQFIIEGISRHALWCFLHSHQFYNSEQVSQRYVTVDPSAVYVPPELQGSALTFYRNSVEQAHRAYTELTGLLEPSVRGELLRRFPSLGRPVHNRKFQTLVRRRAQEVARYVLPLATTAHLHHTVSAVTLLRYHRMCRHPDAPGEIRELVDSMVDLLLDVDPDFETILEEPLAELPVGFFLGLEEESPGTLRAFREEFDGRLGPLASLLHSDPFGLRKQVADAVRSVLAIPSSRLDDTEAIRMVLDPSRNPLLAETLNVTTLDPLSRSLHQATVTFATRLSHTADSQNQRHRMVPGARPVLAAAVDDEPDYIVPSLVAEDDAVRARYGEVMERAWAAVAWMRRRGPHPSLASYLLPNAVAVRIVETADLLHLHHKMRMRLCWNAQDEIRKVAWQQAMQVAQADPLIGNLLMPPCGVRRAAGRTPYCPEGDRYCGTPVWKLSLAEQKPG